MEQRKIIMDKFLFLIVNFYLFHKRYILTNKYFKIALISNIKSKSENNYNLIPYSLVPKLLQLNLDSAYKQYYYTQIKNNYR